jgi:hypothetical protein
MKFEKLQNLVELTYLEDEDEYEEELEDEDEYEEELEDEDKEEREQEDGGRG